jgi:2'-5' RNA ligase
MRTPHLRLFIALWPPAGVREALVLWQREWQWPERASVVVPERLHATIHFLGDVAPERVLDLKYVLKSVPTPSFELQFGQAAIWQHGTAVIRPTNSPTALRGLHARIGLALAEIDMPADDRPYRPHVTLARRATGATPPAQPAAFAWEANHGFVLVQTLSGGRGYEILEKFGS